MYVLMKLNLINMLINYALIKYIIDKRLKPLK